MHTRYHYVPVKMTPQPDAAVGRIIQRCCDEQRLTRRTVSDNEVSGTVFAMGLVWAS